MALLKNLCKAAIILNGNGVSLTIHPNQTVEDFSGTVWRKHHDVVHGAIELIEDEVTLPTDDLTVVPTEDEIVLVDEVITAPIEEPVAAPTPTPKKKR